MGVDVVVGGAREEWSWCAGEWEQLVCEPQSLGDPLLAPWWRGFVSRPEGLLLAPLCHTLCLPFPRHLLMITVPVVYNYQFDKFRSSLLIIIISFHSVRLQEFNNNINNGG